MLCANGCCAFYVYYMYVYIIHKVYIRDNKIYIHMEICVILLSKHAVFFYGFFLSALTLSSFETRACIVLMNVCVVCVCCGAAYKDLATIITCVIVNK